MFTGVPKGSVLSYVTVLPRSVLYPCISTIRCSFCGHIAAGNFLYSICSYLLMLPRQEECPWQGDSALVSSEIIKGMMLYAG